MSNPFSSSIQSSSSSLDHPIHVLPPLSVSLSNHHTSSITKSVPRPSTSSYPTDINFHSFRSSRKRTPEELDIIRRCRARFVSRLALDHTAVLSPDIDTPFADAVDLVNRLLPYHVFQQPAEDLERLKVTGKGKGKATFENELRKEIAETKFALKSFKRREALRTRFRNIKVRSGKRSAPTDQAYVLAQAVLDADRSEANMLNNELRATRAELERQEKEKRIAATSARPVFYGSPLPTQTPTHLPYYRAYPYAYTQLYSAPIQSNSASVTSVANYAPTQIGGAIPVQLPVASLPALHALGIVPIPTTSLPLDGQQQPAAVLRGSSANGTMLNLEINVSLLQSFQMSGLALVLNSLVSRNSSASEATHTLPPVSNENK